MDGLYIEALVLDREIYVDTRTMILLYILHYCHSNFNIYIVEKASADQTRCLRLSQAALCELNYTVLTTADVLNNARQCLCPLIVSKNGLYIQSGLCCVLRTVIKHAEEHGITERVGHLLGLKQMCLKAPAEVSSWTRFCEVDIPDMVSKLLHSEQSLEFQLPHELLRLENHFSEPPIVNNIGKRRREALKGANQSNSPTCIKGSKGPQATNTHLVDAEKASSAIQRSGCEAAFSPELDHSYAEGIDFTLTDLVLFPCVSCVLMQWQDHIPSVRMYLPRIIRWYSRVSTKQGVIEAMVACDLPLCDLTDHNVELQMGCSKAVKLPADDMDTSSLNIRDPLKKKVKANMPRVTEIVQKLQDQDIRPDTSQHPCQDSLQLPWQEFPAAVHPSRGDLPAKRTERKCQQLENLASAVRHLAKEGDVIVDFCSGGGHLGIVMAHLLPQCKIILVENKEESIGRAAERVAQLGLCNVTLYQCNLDYFTGHFDVGVCLHACGVATDLVIQSCLNQQAAFVVCPCCYGSIHNTHTVTYPRSKLFQNASLSYEEYMVLGHGADQTQFSIALAQQGKLCMNYVDMDRSALAQEHGYRVTVCTLDPPKCSPKNNLLIGHRDRR